MIRLRTNRNGWRDIYLSPVASANLAGLEPDQSNPNYVASGIAFCRLAFNGDSDRREESVWLMLDVAAVGAATAFSILSTFLREDVLDLAMRSLDADGRIILKSEMKSRSDAMSDRAKQAERDLATLAARIELPARVRIHEPIVRAPRTPILLLAALLVLNLVLLAFAIWPSLDHITVNPSTTNPSTTSMDSILQAIKVELQAQKPEMQKAVSDAIATGLKPEVQERSREQLTQQIRAALDKIRQMSDGWGPDDGKLAQRIVDEISSK